MRLRPGISHNNLLVLDVELKGFVDLFVAKAGRMERMWCKRESANAYYEIALNMYKMLGSPDPSFARSIMRSIARTSSCYYRYLSLFKEEVEIITVEHNRGAIDDYTTEQATDDLKAVLAAYANFLRSYVDTTMFDRLNRMHTQLVTKGPSKLSGVLKQAQNLRVPCYTCCGTGQATHKE